MYVSGASTLTISDSTISDNSAQGGQGASGNESNFADFRGGTAYGGGLDVNGSGWTVTLTGDTLSGNTATGGNGGNGAAGANATGSNAAGGNGGNGGDGGAAEGGAAYFNGSGNASGSLTILNDSANPMLFLDNSVQGGNGGNGGNGGTSTGTATNSNGGNGGTADFPDTYVEGGALYILTSSAFTDRIGNTTFYGNTVTGGNGGTGGAAGTGGLGPAGYAGTNQGGGPAKGGGLALEAYNITMVNCTVAKNNATAGADGGPQPAGPYATAYGGGIYMEASLDILANNTITQNTIGPGFGAGVYVAGNPTFVNNLLQGNLGYGSYEADLDGGSLTAATDNFITGVSPYFGINRTTNIIGNSQVQLGSVVGVDSSGKPSGGPIYYPLLSGVVSIGAGTTQILNNIAAVEGTTPANAVDEIGNLRSTNGSIDLGAVQFTTSSHSSAPVITSNPSSQTVMAGANVSFTASASGTPAPTVQWQVSTDHGKTFTNISGATSTTLTLNNVSMSISGDEYEAVFTNSKGTATSNAATLTVNPPPPPSPPPAPSPPPPPPTLHVPPLLALFDLLLGGTETINANGTETITDSLFGIPLLVATFDHSGNLMSVALFGFNITFLFV